MRIDLAKPDAVWQAAHLILTQPQATAIFAKALALQAAGGSGSGVSHIRLTLCHALALFSANDIPASLAAARTALAWAAQKPPSVG